MAPTLVTQCPTASSTWSQLTGCENHALDGLPVGRKRESSRTHVVTADPGWSVSLNGPLKVARRRPGRAGPGSELRALLSVAMQRDESYWQGVRGRLPSALAVGLIAAVILWWLDDIRAALAVGFAAAALLPSRRLVEAGHSGGVP